MTVPGSTEGPAQGPAEGAAFDARAYVDESMLPKTTTLPNGSTGAWLENYYNALYPNGPPASPADLQMLNKSICAAINTSMNEINARQAEAQDYNEKVAKGEE